uniref:Uncharacterized protein n=1 Tax=Globodera rostochiensis TaxID=31243 RepID=A0A914IBU9_GLORO
MPTTGAAGQSGQPPKKRVQFKDDAILVQTRRYEPNPAEWTAFDAQSQPRRQMIRGGNNIRAEDRRRREKYAQKGEETAAIAAGWRLIGVDGAVERVEPGANSVSRAIETERCANTVGHFWQNRTSIPELQPLDDENGTTGADEWFCETMAIPLELVPAGNDAKQMQPTAAFVESAAGAIEVSGKDQPIESGTNHWSLDGGRNECQQLLSDIRALLDVPEMSAEETANALERCGTRSPREICAEMLRMLEAPLGSEVSDDEHSKEKQPVDGEKTAPVATNASEMNSDILHPSEAEEASEEATNLVVYVRREVEAVQQAEKEEETRENDAKEDQNGEKDDDEEEEEDEEEEDEEEEEESVLPPGLFDDTSSGEENADEVGQKWPSPKLPRPAIGFGLHPCGFKVALEGIEPLTKRFQIALVRRDLIIKAEQKNSKSGKKSAQQ